MTLCPCSNEHWAKVKVRKCLIILCTLMQVVGKDYSKMIGTAYGIKLSSGYQQQLLPQKAARFCLELATMEME